MCSELRKIMSPYYYYTTEEEDEAKRVKVPLFRVRRHAVIEDVIEICTDDKYLMDGCDDGHEYKYGSSSLFKQQCPLPITTPIVTNESISESKSESIPCAGDHNSNQIPIVRSAGAQSQWPNDVRVVICDRLCGEAVLRGSNAFVKGILVADTNIQKGDRIAVYAHLHDNTPHATDSKGKYPGDSNLPTIRDTVSSSV